MGTTTAGPIRIHFRDDAPVVVTPDDEDRFVTTASEAARACRQAQDMLRWKREFDEFLAVVYRWCVRQKDVVSCAYVTFSPDGLQVFVVTSGDRYRFDF